jgi:hypothetical protein
MVSNRLAIWILSAVGSLGGKDNATAMPPCSWYEDLGEMARDDEWLQTVYQRLRWELSAEARARTRTVHVYPSRRCSHLGPV